MALFQDLPGMEIRTFKYFLNSEYVGHFK